MGNAGDEKGVLMAMFRSIAVVLALLGAAGGVRAATFILPPEGTDLVGVPSWVHTRYEDTLMDVARDYSVGYTELKRANPGVDTWIPGVGTRVLLPTRYVLPPGPREGWVWMWKRRSTRSASPEPRRPD